MEPRDVSIVSSSSRKMTVESSRKMTTITSSSSSSGAGGRTVTSQRTEYSVHQSGQGGQPGLQFDQPTDLPQVEMVFSVDPVQQPSPVTLPALTVSDRLDLLTRYTFTACYTYCAGPQVRTFVQRPHGHHNHTTTTPQCSVVSA